MTSDDARRSLIQIGFLKRLTAGVLDVVAIFLRIWNRLTKRPNSEQLKRVVVLEPFGMGDLISHEPMLRMLREQGWSVAVCARPEWRPLFPNVPWIDCHAAWGSHLPGNKYGFGAYATPAFRQFLTNLHRHSRGAIGIDTRGDIRNVILLYLAGCHRVITVSRYLASNLCILPLAATVVPFSSSLRRWEQNLLCGEKIGVRITNATPPAFPHLATTTKANPRQIGIIPLAPWAGKFWPKERWAETITKLQSQGSEVVALCGPGQSTLTSALLGTEIPIIESASVHEYAANLQTCRFIVTVDTGPMHLADALGVPVVALFGVGVLPLWAPSHALSTVVTRRDVPNFRVALASVENTETGRAAMQRITTSDVLEGIAHVLHPRTQNGEIRRSSPVKLAMSILCENPFRRTGLTTAYHEFVARSLKLYTDVSWIIFAGHDQPWNIEDSRVTVIRDYPANNHLWRRLFSDHFLVPGAARRLGADVMVSTGFTPVRKCLPTVMHVLSLQHLGKSNCSRARTIYRKLVMTRTWHKADLIITNSKVAENQLLEVFPEFRNRLVQAYEGLQHEQFRPQGTSDEAVQLEKELSLRPGYFLSVSNFYPYKQPRLLIDAYAALEPEIRRKHPLIMVGGEWENELALCKARVAELRLENDVRFLGWVADAWLPILYRQALAFCWASREETFGRSVLEAMACGTPVLVHDIPIMHEVTEGHAMIVDFEKPGEATKALRNLVIDDSLRQRLAAGGLQRAQRFTFEKYTIERVDPIRRLCDQNGALASVPIT